MLNRVFKPWSLRPWRLLIATLFVIAAPTAALAARGYATADVRMRAGPGTEYPVVATVPNGAHLTIHGCLSEEDWCDVSWSGDRGWISATYLNYFYNNRYVYLPDYFDRIDVPVVTFALGTYWDNYYTGRPWYHRRAHWARVWRGHDRRGHAGRPDRHHGGIVRPGRDAGMARHQHHRGQNLGARVGGRQVGAHRRGPQLGGHRGRANFTGRQGVPHFGGHAGRRGGAPHIRAHGGGVPHFGGGRAHGGGAPHFGGGRAHGGGAAHFGGGRHGGGGMAHARGGGGGHGRRH